MSVKICEIAQFTRATPGSFLVSNNLVIFADFSFRHFATNIKNIDNTYRTFVKLIIQRKEAKDPSTTPNKPSLLHQFLIGLPHALNNPSSALLIFFNHRKILCQMTF